MSSGMILHRTLTTLGLDPDLIKVHLLVKGTNVFSAVEQERLEKTITENLADSPPSAREARIIVVDQGSRPGPPLVRESAVGAHTRTLIIDHHMSDKWPEGAEVLTACNSPPISTSSLLTYLTCRTLHTTLPQATAWYCLLGVFGDLSPSEVDWGNPAGTWPASPEMSEVGEVMKALGKKSLSSAVGAINARERGVRHNKRRPLIHKTSQLVALLNTTSEMPGRFCSKLSILMRLLGPVYCGMRGRKSTWKSSDVRTPRPNSAKTAESRFSELTVAIRVGSDICGVSHFITRSCAVHPVIATRWAGTLRGAKKLQMIMVENEGHNPDPEITSFSCRMPTHLRKLPEGERPNLIALLKEFGELVSECGGPNRSTLTLLHTDWKWLPGPRWR